MKMNYISMIQSNLKQYVSLHASKATTNIMDGSYKSIYKGRSMNFDELREYNLGDEIKDMDWKASSRCRKLLVRQYIAEKKHNVLFVMDTSKRMFADSPCGKEKRELALVTAGSLAYIVSENGDYIGAVQNINGTTKYYPFKTGLLNLEAILDSYYNGVTIDNESNLATSLDYIIYNISKRMIVVIVTDMEGINLIPETTLKRLRSIHDVLLINIKDTDTFGKSVFDVSGGVYLSEFFTADKRLKKKEEKRRKQIEESALLKLSRVGIAATSVGKPEDLDLSIIELLEKHRLGR
ncbi:MAG: DUF58 domain-containing protein [Lachnospiraceae bacterium]|nr:DUF58 domain-containing protein [Lachnospiraceae bacterium]